DYALLMIFRFRDELREGKDVETALVETMTHAGKAVVVSGSAVAVGLLSLIVLPLPFIRSIGIGGMLIPAVSVLAAITLLPALLAVLGERINSRRRRPRRLVDHGHPEDGPWGRWARFVNVRPVPVAAVGLVITGVLVYYGFQLNPNEAQLKNVSGRGDAIVGRDALTTAAITPGVLKPLDVLVENGRDPEAVAERLGHVDGITATAPQNDWRTGVPITRAAAQGRHPQPRLARGSVRDRGHRLPAGARLGDLGDRRDAGDQPLDSDDDLRLPLRPLNGLRGLHAHAHARGLRRD